MLLAHIQRMRRQHGLSQLPRPSTQLASVKRSECVEDYMLYVEAEGKLLNSGDITRLDRALYLRIHKRFGSWDAFMRMITALLLPNWRKHAAQDVTPHSGLE